MKLRIFCMAFLMVYCGTITLHAKKNKTPKQKSINCSELTHCYRSYQEAFLIIKSAKFEYHKKKLTNLTNLHKIEYFSCDKKTGYLLLIFSNDMAMLHQNVPLNIWQNIFIQDDPVEYYERNIKQNDKYKLQVLDKSN